LVDETNVTELTLEVGCSRLVRTYQIAQSYRKEWNDRVDKGEKLHKTCNRRKQKITKLSGTKRKTVQTLKTGYEIHPEDGGTTLL
jgi:hypothetical protein